MNKRAPTLQQNQNDGSLHLVQIQRLQAQLAEKSRLLEQAQQRLAELEVEHDFFKVILNYLPTPVFVKEAEELRFVAWNKASEALFGFSQEVILGKNDYDLFLSHEADFFTDKDRLVLAGDQVLDIPEEPIHTAHQGVRWLHTRKIPIRGQDGQPKYLLGVSEDITERRETEEAIAKQAHLAAFTGDIGLVLTQAATLPEMLQKSTEVMVKHLDAAFARIWAYNPTENVLELRASAGIYTHINGPHARVPVGQFKIGLIAQERQPHLTNDVLNDPRVGDKEWARREGMLAFAGYPLIVDERLVGVMALFARQLLSEDVLQAMQSVANMIALSIERKQAEEVLAKRAAELTCLNDIGRELEISPPVPDLLEWVTGRIPPAMQYPLLCRAAIEYEGQVYGVPEAVNLPAHMAHGLYIGGELKGRIYISYTEKYDFLNEESALLGGIASRLSSHLENRHLFEQVQARVRREQLLREVTTRIRGSVDVDTVMRTVAREVGQALGRPAFIYLEPGSDGQETPPFAEKEEA
jgi:PAS domain S-box-containing protein